MTDDPKAPGCADKPAFAVSFILPAGSIISAAVDLGASLPQAVATARCEACAEAFARTLIAALAGSLAGMVGASDATRFLETVATAVRPHALDGVPPTPARH